MENNVLMLHLCPTVDSDIMPCCGKTLFEVPRSARLTKDPKLVTCKKGE